MLENLNEKTPIKPVFFEDESVPVGRNDRGMMTGVRTYISESEEERVPLFRKLRDVSEVRVETREACGVVTPGSSMCSKHEGEVPLAEQIKCVAKLNDTAEYSFDNATGKAYAEIVKDLNKEKIKESTVLTAKMTDCGLLRAKRFADGKIIYHALTEARIVGGKKWRVGEMVYFTLCIQNFRDFNKQWTEVYCLDELEEVKFVGSILSRYLCPAESRAYQLAAIKSLKSEIYSIVKNLKEEELVTHVGWKSKMDEITFVDGEAYPLRDSVISLLRKPQIVESANIEQIIREIVNELRVVDCEKRIRFLIAYGMVAWFSSIVGAFWSNSPGLLLTGERRICRDYAEYFLKFCRREEGNDILTLSETDDAWLTEYIKVLRDDVFAYDCFEAGKRAKTMRCVIAGNGMANQKLRVPLVVLQKFSAEEIDYCNFVVVDILGYSKSTRLFYAVGAMKGILMELVERHKKNFLEHECNGMASFEECWGKVCELLISLLIQAGVSAVLAEEFLMEIGSGVNLIRNQMRSDYKVSVLIFKQRLQWYIHQGDIKVELFSQITGKAGAEEMAWIKGDRLLIPVSYFKRVVLPMLEMSESEWKTVRNRMLSKGILRCYGGSEFTKQVSLPSGKRVRVIDMSKEFVCSIDTL